MSDERRMASISQIVDQLRALGVEQGAVMVVHTSFRAVRPVDGGPAGLIEALGRAIGPQGTLVLPSETGEWDKPFDPAKTSATQNLGVVPEVFRQMPGVRRSDHPFAFAARGPKASEITSDPLILPPYQRQSPLGRVLDLDGEILLLGVGHDSNTTLHLAEMLAGVRYRRTKYFTVLRATGPERVDYDVNDCCCQLFTLADQWLNEIGLQSEGYVGHARTRLVRAKDVVATAVAKLRRDPLIFLHRRGTGCAECDDAWQSIDS